MNLKRVTVAVGILLLRGIACLCADTAARHH